MGALFLLSNVVPGDPGAARTQVKEGGSDSLSGAAGAAVTDPHGARARRIGAVPLRRLVGAALGSPRGDGRREFSGVCSASGQPMDKHSVRFDFGVTNATLIVLAAPQFWAGDPATPWMDAGGAVADTFFTQIMPGAMPAVLNVTLPDIVDHAKANHANALASVW